MKEFLKALGYFLAMLVFVLSAVFLSQWLNNDKDQNNQNNNSSIVVRSDVECPPDIESYTAFKDKSAQVVSLIGQRQSMFATNGEFVNSKIIVTKNETETSKVACGYLLARAGTETNGGLQSWENLYINPAGFGGHIDIENQFGVGDGNKYSEYLFSLNEIEYWKTRQDHAENKLQNADWAALLNVQSSVAFDIALNTNDKSGFIDEVSVAYKCWNPKTGEENSDCKIEVTSKTDTQSQSLN